MPTSCGMWELVETAQSYGDDTHAVATGLIRACEHGLRTGVVTNVGGLRAWLTDRCSNRDAGNSASKTPTLCATDRKR